ncbi:MAG: ketoacyl-ACP synthase III [Devosia sp.]|nr:ketoacyl-ACP synthase III [Devosia sp.]
MWIEGTGVALPATVRLSSELDRRLGRPEGWLFRRTGVFSRPVAVAEDQVELAVRAATAALADAGRSPDEIDVVLFAAAVPYQSIPATAPLIQRQLGMADGAAAAFDINSTCLSFLSAMDLLASLVGTGRYRRGLVVSAEIASRALPWESAPETAGLFGDGAAAAVLSAGDGGSGVVAAAMETYPSGYDACRLGSGGTRYDFAGDREAFACNAIFEMEGEALFRLTLRTFPRFLDRLLAAAGWDRGEIDVVVPHQASPGALAHLARKSGFGTDVVIDIMRERGNQIAASLPSALHAARQAGRMLPGAKVLMLGTSAGVSLGGLALVA